MAGAPKGNTNAVKGRLLSKTLQKRLEERADLERLAEVLIEKALGGDMAAIREVFDRIDGKPKQAIVGGDEEDQPILIRRIELVPLSDDNSS